MTLLGTKHIYVYIYILINNFSLQTSCHGCVSLCLYASVQFVPKVPPWRSPEFCNEQLTGPPCYGSRIPSTCKASYWRYYGRAPLLATFSFPDGAPRRIGSHGRRLISLKNNSSPAAILLCALRIVRRIQFQTCDKQGAKLDAQLLPLSPISDTNTPPLFALVGPRWRINER